MLTRSRQALLIFTFGALLAGGCSRETKQSARVIRRDIVGLVAVTGKAVIPPADRADVFAHYVAPVAQVFASVGQTVKRGEVLMELSAPSAQAAYQQYRLNIRAAERELAGARRNYDISVKTAERQLTEARTTERSVRQAAESSAQNDVEGADTAAVPPSPDTVPALEQAVANRVTAEQVLLQARSERESALAPYLQRLEDLRAGLREAQAGRKGAAIRAPIGGEVLALNAKVNQEVGRDEKKPVATIVDLSALRVEARIRPADVGYVKAGIAVTMSFDGVPNESFEGKVREVRVEAGGAPSKIPGTARGGLSTPTTSAAPVHTAVIEFKNDQGLVKPDMPAKISAQVGKAANALAVPSGAVETDESGKPVVNVLSGKEWKPTVVEVGLSDGQYTEIRSGLKEGETVRVTTNTGI